MNGTELLTKTVDGYWQKDSDGLFLIKNYNNQYHSDKSVAEYAIGYASGANLYYDGGHNKQNWYDANNLCLNRGWRLADNTEMDRAIVNGIPSYINITWGEIRHDANGIIYHFGWSGSSGTWYDSDSLQYVRCVK